MKISVLRLVLDGRSLSTAVILTGCQGRGPVAGGGPPGGPDGAACTCSVSPIGRSLPKYLRAMAWVITAVSGWLRAVSRFPARTGRGNILKMSGSAQAM